MGDIADIVGGGTPSTGNQSYWDGDIDWYAPAEIADQIYANSSQKKITGLGYENSSAKMLPPGTVLFTSRAGIGKTAILTRKGCTNQGFQSIVPHRGELDTYFIFSRTEELKRYGELVGAGSTFVEVSGKQMAVMELIMPPTMREQQTIGGFFQQLDHLITLHQRKCIFFTGRAGRLISTVNKKRITSSWEQRKFDEVFDCTVPNNTLSRAELSYDEGTVLNVHYGDVLIKYGSVLDVQKDDIPRIPHRCREDFNGALLQDGDVIIADTAEDETTGKACEIGNLQGSAIVSGLHTMVCRPRNRMALGYLGYYLNSNAYHHQLLPLMQGIKVLSLSRSNIQKTSVSYPIAVKEQQLIAYYFSQLDNLITLHQRQPFLQSPPDISLIVQLTPPFYTFSWEQRKLGDMMNVTSVKRIHQSDWTDSGVRFLRARDIVAAAKNEEPDDYLYISKEKYEEYSTLSGKVGVSDLLVTGVGTIGVPYLVRNLEPLYFKDGNIIWFQNSDKIDGKFLFYSFSAEQIQGFINESAGIGTVGTYTIESGKKTPISLPNQIEQAKVGEFFQQLDNLITLHQRQTIVYAVIRIIRKVILAERQYFAPPMIRKSP